MSYDYSENGLVQESAGDLLQNELGWDVKFAYDTEELGDNGTFGRKSYKEILLSRYFREAMKKFNPWLTDAQIAEAQTVLEKRLSTASPMQDNIIRDTLWRELPKRYTELQIPEYRQRIYEYVYTRYKDAA